MTNVTKEQIRSGLRTRTRRAVRREITDTAQILFEKQGYDATTIDDIAMAVGMSTRSIFRYFPTKEDLVLGKLDFVTEEMLSILAQRPDKEPTWLSLRRMFDVMLFDSDEVGKIEVAEAVLRMIFTTPALFASYLLKLQNVQDQAFEIILDRIHNIGTPMPCDAPSLRARIAAAFGCLIAAQKLWMENEPKRPLEVILDCALNSVTPADDPTLP